MIFKRRTYKELSDAELIDSFRMKGSKKLFEEIYFRYSHLVLGTCMKYLKNEQDAEDCTMHIFETLPARIMRQPIDHFSSWLYRVVVNESLQSLRKSKKNVTNSLLDDYNPPDTTENDSSTDIAIELILDYLTELKHDQKQCVTDFYLNKKSYQQIAEENNWTIKQVKSAIQNGKRNLRLKYEEHEANKPT